MMIMMNPLPVLKAESITSPPGVKPWQQHLLEEGLKKRMINIITIQDYFQNKTIFTMKIVMN